MTEAATLGARIKAARRKRRLTQEQLAAAAGITRTTVQNIEAGRTGTTHHIQEIADALDVNVEYLLDDDQPTVAQDDRGPEQVVIRVRTPRQKRFAERLRVLIEEMDAEDAEEAARRAMATPDEGSGTAIG